MYSYDRRASGDPEHKAVAERIKSALSHMHLGIDSDPVEVSADYKEISTAYRSRNLPKDGAYEVGHNRYDEMVNEEVAMAQKAVDRLLSSYKAHIADIKYGVGEKGWIFITVILK